MKQPKPAYEHSPQWRLWHSINYLIGGILFVVGSILLFPRFDTTLIIDQISVWFYVIGSLALVLADASQLLHYASNWDFLPITICICVNVTSTFLYLVGSILLLPSIDNEQSGMNLFIVGSFLLSAAQTYKIIRICRRPNKSIKQNCC